MDIAITDHEKNKDLSKLLNISQEMIDQTDIEKPAQYTMEISSG